MDQAEDDEQPEELEISQVPTVATSLESTPGVESVMVMGKLMLWILGAS